jgi:cell division protein FtsI (penicillin-binding protein 3)
MRWLVIFFIACGAHVQSIADDELARAVADWHPEQAFILILEDHHVVANAGWDHGHVAPELALEHAYVTGSTLKPFTVAIALDAGAIHAGDTFDCHTRTYPDGELDDAEPHGACSVTDILVTSSNVGTSRIIDRLGDSAFARGLASLGFGPLPTVAPNTRREGLFAAGELAEATPLQLARAYDALFFGGAVSPATARRVRDMLEQSIRVGTGAKAQVAGYRVAGKTGTAVIGEHRLYASFVGTVLDRRSLVILVGLVAPERGGTGPTAAAPMFARVASRILTTP